MENKNEKLINMAKNEANPTVSTSGKPHMLKNLKSILILFKINQDLCFRVDVLELEMQKVNLRYEAIEKKMFIYFKKRVDGEE